MSGSLNKVILIGNLGRDPEMKMTQAGHPFAKFSLATTETWKGQSGEKKSKTEWHEVVVWGKLAEIAEKYLRKGKQVMVEGSIRYQEVIDQNKAKRKYTSINCDNFVMLGRADDGSRPSGGGYDRHPTASAEPDYDDPMPPPPQGGYDDDIPF
jgi:single-strand DNA-binding protein